MTQFKDRQQQELYTLYTLAPPKGRGSGIAVAYDNGLRHPDLSNRYVRNSLAYAAWAAGRDASKRACKIALGDTHGH